MTENRRTVTADFGTWTRTRKTHRDFFFAAHKVGSMKVTFHETRKAAEKAAGESGTVVRTNLADPRVDGKDVKGPNVCTACRGNVTTFDGRGVHAPDGSGPFCSARCALSAPRNRVS